MHVPSHFQSTHRRASYLDVPGVSNAGGGGGGGRRFSDISNCSGGSGGGRYTYTKLFQLIGLGSSIKFLHSRASVCMAAEMLLSGLPSNRANRKVGSRGDSADCPSGLTFSIGGGSTREERRKIKAVVVRLPKWERSRFRNSDHCTDSIPLTRHETAAFDGENKIKLGGVGTAFKTRAFRPTTTREHQSRHDTYNNNSRAHSRESSHNTPTSTTAAREMPAIRKEKGSKTS